MILFLTLLYCGVLFLLVKKGVLSWNLWTKLSPVLVMVFLTVVLVFPLQFAAPSGAVLVYRYTVPIVPRVGGEVIEVPVVANTPLKKGDVLFRIDPEPYENEVKRLKAQLELAGRDVEQLKEQLQGVTARVAEAQAGIEALASTLKGARANVQAASANLDAGRKALESAEAAVGQAQVDLEVQQRQHDRTKELVAEGVEPEASLDNQTRLLAAKKAAVETTLASRSQAESTISALEAQVAASKAAEQETVSRQAGLRAQLLQAEAQERTAQLALAPEIDGRHASIANIEAQLATARYNLDATTVRAPADGFVTNVALQPGARAAAVPTLPSMSFIDTSRTVIGMQIYQSFARLCVLGPDAEIAFKFRPGEVAKARVEYVLQAVSTGQVAPGGSAQAPQQPAPGVLFVRLELEDEELARRLPTGAVGQATIYTDSLGAIQIIRKVELRMTSYLDTINPF